MQEIRYDELNTEAAKLLEEQSASLMQKLSAQKAVKTELEAMRSEDKILMLTDEEERILRCFRSFKQRCKPGAVFKWQTRPPEEVTIVEETGLVSDPQDVSGGSGKLRKP